jgi:hypothetical protein
MQLTPDRKFTLHMTNINFNIIMPSKLMLLLRNFQVKILYKTFYYIYCLFKDVIDNSHYRPIASSGKDISVHN